MARSNAPVSRVIGAISDQHPLLMQWNSRFYVVYGVDYVRTEDYSGGATAMIIRKLLLWDPRYSDERRNVLFNRETEGPGNVQGLLFLAVAHGLIALAEFLRAEAELFVSNLDSWRLCHVSLGLLRGSK